MAIYLSIHHMDSVLAELGEGYPPETPVVVAYRVGWPDQALIQGTLADIGEKTAQAGIRRQALILVGDVLGARGGKPSRLYDSSFSHGFRNAKP
jgi:precorrin-4/cobalt-precorrin-4 C11-methyltransferase